MPFKHLKDKYEGGFTKRRASINCSEIIYKFPIFTICYELKIIINRFSFK